MILSSNGGARSVMVIVVGNGDTVTRVQYLAGADSISHSTNNLGEKYESNYSPFNYE